MVTLKDFAKTFEGKKTRNITELEVVNLENLEILEKEGTDKENKPFHMIVGISNNEEYRIPESVMRDIRTIIENKPTLKTIKVIKKGTGMGTTYTVIPLE